MSNQASDGYVSSLKSNINPARTRSGSNLSTDIKTYAVTPLNEECGLIEWVDNLKTLREIVVKLLRERGIGPNVCHFHIPYLCQPTTNI